MTERELHAAILQVLDRPAAEADASAYLLSLVGCGAVVASNGSGEVVYTRASEFPTWPEAVGPGSPSYDARLAEMSAREQEDHDRVAREVERNAPQNRQREGLVRLIDERIERRLAELRRAADGAAITRARELLRRREAG
jgi:hypothetical protein